MVVTVSDTLLEFVSETEPFFLDENLETFQCSIIRIQEEHSQCGKLSCSIPSVGAMYHHRCAHVFDLGNKHKLFLFILLFNSNTHLINYANGPCQYAFDMLQPHSTLNGRQPFLIVIRWEADFFQFSQTLSHDVDVVNVQEKKLNILIRILRFIAVEQSKVRALREMRTSVNSPSAFGFIRNGICTGSSIHNRQLM